jgi:hypothetical protein
LRAPPLDVHALDVGLRRTALAPVDDLLDVLFGPLEGRLDAVVGEVPGPPVDVVGAGGLVEVVTEVNTLNGTG